MKFFKAGLTMACTLAVCGTEVGLSQSTEQTQSDAVRVTVSMHPDGSRTVYKFDNAQHKAVATTTDQDGKLRETIRYELDEAGRFSSGEISGPVIRCLTRPANWSVETALPRSARLLLLNLERKAPDKRTHLGKHQMLTVALSALSHRHLVVRLPQPVKKTTKPA
jgi:hypothetical protein